MTDLPDAEAAWAEWLRDNQGSILRYSDGELFKIGFAAASVSWAEQLDTANADVCTCPPPWNNDHTPNPFCPVDGDSLTKAELARLSQAVETDDGTGYIYAVAYAVKQIIAARLDAALARNAELERENAALHDGIAHLEKRAIENTTARAELDSLRNRVTTLADETGSAFPYVQVRELRAIVRGTNDE